MRRSRSARRAAATTSCDVRSAGLSMTRTPSTTEPPTAPLTSRGDASLAFTTPRLGVAAVGGGEIDRGGDLVLKYRLQFLERAAGAAAGRVLVPATAELLGNRVDIDVA